MRGSSLGRNGGMELECGIARPDPVGSPDTSSSDEDCFDCKKASPWDLVQAGIFDAHQYKKEHGAVPESRYDICKCKDGSIRIARMGQCGKTKDFWN